MATIWDNKNHSSGEKFILSKSVTATVKRAFAKVTGDMIKIDEKEYEKEKNQNIILIPENHKPTKTDIVFHFKASNKAYAVIAKNNLNNGNFTWDNKGKSTNRQMMTDLKELCSLEMMLTECNNLPMYKTDEELMNVVKKNHAFKDMSIFREVYYTSAKAHAVASSRLPFITGTKYEGERQQQNFTKQVYEIAKILTSKAADNWNPSDVWFVAKSKKAELSKFFKDFKAEIRTSELTKQELASKYKSHLDSYLEKGYLIGVSLKQVDSGNARLDKVTYENIRKKSADMDFTVTKCYIRRATKGLPAYGELNTRSGFNIKWGGRANAQKANINLEGQMAGATHQLGAIDAQSIDAMAKAKGMKILKDSNFPNDDYETLVKYMVEYFPKIKESDSATYNAYIRDKNYADMIQEYGFVEIKRFIACISVFLFVDSLDEEEVMDCFFLAKKIHKANPDYYLLH